MLAIRAANHGAVKFLLEQGADPNQSIKINGELKNPLLYMMHLWVELEIHTHNASHTEHYKFNNEKLIHDKNQVIDLFKELHSKGLDSSILHDIAEFTNLIHKNKKIDEELNGSTLHLLRILKC